LLRTFVMKAPSIDKLEYYIVRAAALILLVCAVIRLVLHELQSVLR
jgi:hypothetical protein